ncbi:4-hydroxy-tetrahydrodipicolinate synthase [Candidatus Kapabacteria bacterium]|nr:4-hydroxy-tetrahydrodipicolinate synthase [Candidatus Kapabacteria bacterium]
MTELQGTYTALVTPFNEDMSIDYESFKKLINHQIENGVEGIVVCGSTGESATLNVKEKISLMVTAIDHVKGRIPVIVGTGSNSTSASIDLTLVAKEHGADAVLLVAPYYNKPSQEGLYYHFKAINDACDIPQIIYNVPSRSGVNIQAEVQVKLAKDCKNIIATKEASGNMDQVMEVLRTRPKGFAVLSGEDSLAVPLVNMGADGVIAVTSNYAPKEYSEAIRQALKSNTKTASRMHYKLFESIQMNFVETNPIPVKTALAILGILPEPNFRSPLFPMHQDNRKRLEKALRRAKIGK